MYRALYRAMYEPIGSGPSGDGLLLETGSGYLLLETDDYLLLE